MKSKHAIELALIIIGLLCFVTLLGMSIMHQIDLNNRADEAQKQVDAANENLAQSLANMPWTLEHINSYISQNYSGNEAQWLTQRVAEIRASGGGYQP